jgi:hypothetical protein
MEDNTVSITITEREEHPKVLGISIPFFTYSVCNSWYSGPGGAGIGNEDGSSPLESLTDLLVNVEANRQNRNGKQIGSIHATFDLIGKGRGYGIAMEELLKMYARSEQTDVTFEYKSR